MALERPAAARGIRAALELARSDEIEARTWANPELRFARERADALGDGDAVETSVFLSQVIEVGGRRGLQRRAAALGMDAARATAALDRLELRAETLRRYYALVVAEQRVQAHVHAAAMLVELARVARERFAAGDLSGFESGRIQQSHAQAQGRLAEAEVERGHARAELVALLGRAAQDMQMDLEASIVPETTPPRPQQADSAPSTAVTALQLRRDQADAAVRAADRWAVPVAVGVGRKRFETPGGSDDALLLEISVPLPLFDRNQAARTRARAEAAIADARYQQASAALEGRQEATWHEAQRLSEIARHLRDEVVPRADELTATARASFAEGELELVGLLDALDARAGLIDQSLDLQYRARLAALELDYLSAFEPTLEEPIP